MTLYLRAMKQRPPEDAKRPPGGFAGLAPSEGHSEGNGLTVHRSVAVSPSAVVVRHRRQVAARPRCGSVAAKDEEPMRGLGKRETPAGLPMQRGFQAQAQFRCPLHSQGG